MIKSCLLFFYTTPYPYFLDPVLKMLIIFNLPQTEEAVVAFFQERGILPTTKKCINGHEMALYVNDHIWRCNVKNCKKKKKIRVRADNCFSGSRIPFLTALRFIYCWAELLTSLKWCDKQLSMSDHTTVDWNNFLREVCSLQLMKLPPQKNWRTWQNCGGRREFIRATVKQRRKNSPTTVDIRRNLQGNRGLFFNAGP